MISVLKAWTAVVAQKDRHHPVCRDLSYGLIIRNQAVAGYQAALEIPQPAVATVNFYLSKSNYNIFVDTFGRFNDILI